MTKNKLKQWLTLLLLFTNAVVVWGQATSTSPMPQNGKVYRINSLGAPGSEATLQTPHYVTSDVVTFRSKERLKMTSTLNENDPKFYFRATGGSTNQFSLYSLAKRAYFTASLWYNNNTSPFRSTPDPMVFTNHSSYLSFKLEGQSPFVVHADLGNMMLERAGNATNTNAGRFIFTQVNASVITIAPNVAGLGATYTFNNQNGINDQFVALLDNGLHANGVTLAQSGSPAGYTFTGFTWTGQPTPEPSPTIPLSTLQNNPELVVTANYAPSFYSSRFGEKWVRIFMVRTGAEKYAWRLNDGANGEGLKITTAPVDYADDRFLWCLVGNDGTNFKLQNKATGAEFALTTSVNDPAENAVPFLTAVGSAKNWKHSVATAENKSGYKFNVTTGNDNRSPNAHGGAGRGLAYWSIDGGSIWRVEYANATVTLTPSVSNVADISDTQKQMARVQVVGTTAGMEVSSQAIIRVNEPKLLHLPLGGNFTLGTPTAMRNFGTISAPYSSPQAVTEENSSYNITGTYVNENAHYLFSNTTASVGHYSVPAVAVAPNGDILAVANYSVFGEKNMEVYRTSAKIMGGSDRGVVGGIRLALRVGNSNGATWGQEELITPEGVIYGDAAITADHKENKVLVVMAKVTNGRTFENSNRNSRLEIARMIGTNTNGRWTWETPTDITAQIYGLSESIVAAYFTSGRILQSKVVKGANGTFRVYASLITRESTNTNWKNRVVYSDDFGQNWRLLGGADALAIDVADEATLMELPNGNLVISSRKSGGRKFNVFTYTNIASNEGSWGVQAEGLADKAACNGDMLLLNVKQGSEKKMIALHSLPNTNNYSNVGIHHKEANVSSITGADWTNWSSTYAISSTSSGYSTMDVQKDGSIGFFFEENQAGAGYDMVYKVLPISTFNQAYTVDTDVATEAVAVANNPGFVGSYTAEEVRALAEANTAYNSNSGTTLLRNVEAEMNHLKVFKERVPFEPNKYYRLYNTDNKAVATNYNGGIIPEDEDATKVSQFWKVSEIGTNATVINPNEPQVGTTSISITSTDGVNHTMTLRNGSEVSYRLKPVESVGVSVRSTHSTFCFPFAVTKPEDAKVYKGNQPTLNSESKVVLKELADANVPANTPVVLYAPNTTRSTAARVVTFPIVYGESTSTPTVQDNVLRGMLAPATLQAGDYILKTVDGVAGFYPVNRANSNTTMMGVANKVYIPAATFAGSPSFLPITDGEEPTTDINGVVIDGKAVKYYNLNGTLVTKPVPGVLYITSEGKKVIFK